MPSPVLEAPKPTKPDDPPTEGGEDEGSASSAGAERAKNAATALIGTRVPSVDLMEMRNGRVEHWRSEALFAKRRVILFALPGAFTPTCSTAHVPGYVARVRDFQDAGIDAIFCVSVNDPYVMEAWQRSEKAQAIRFLADPDGRFAQAIGLAAKHPENGLGLRSRRYSMLVDDGKIEAMFLEAEGPNDPFEVSDAETMWRYLRPDQKGRGSAFLLAREGCVYCARAKDLLTRQGIPYEAVYLGDELTMLGVRAATAATTVPQVFMEGKLVGGADQLALYLGVSASA